MMFELSDLHKFMTNKAGAFSLDLAFCTQTNTLHQENNQFALLTCSIASIQYVFWLFFFLKNDQIILSILTLFNGALYHCAILHMYLINGLESATSYLYL